MNRKMTFTSYEEEEIELHHGDLISVISSEESCGLELTFHTIVCVIENGVAVGIPNDPISHAIRSDHAGVSFLIDLEWLVEQNVELTVIHRLGRWEE